ncbi:MAG: substrate-binding domain-containing protein [Suipraeoptans sp.]
MIKKVISIISMIILCSTLFIGCKSFSVQGKALITVITKTTETDFWRAVKGGCNAAANEYNVDMIFQGPDNEEDFEAQNKMIEDAIENGTQAIVLSAIDQDKSIEVIEKAAARGIYIVIIDSGINSGIPEVIISTDNYAAGEKAGEAMLNVAYTELKIGMVNFAQGTANGQEREEGFTDVIEKAKGAQIVGKVSVDSNLESAKKGTFELIKEHPEINAIIAFNEFTTLGAGSAVDDLGLSNSIKVIGFDNNNTAIGLLEDGVIEGLMVQNQFAIGYLGVESAYNLIAERYIEEREIYMEVTLVDSTNLFEENIQKIVFPLENNN